MSGRRALIALALALLALTGWSSVYTVAEDQLAVRLRWGGTVAAEGISPGLHFKWPWGIEEAVVYDRRVQSSSYGGESFASRDGRSFRADLVIKWRVRNAGTYHRRTGGNDVVAADRLAALFRESIGNVAAQRTLAEIVGADAEVFSAPVFERSATQAGDLGVSLVDARIVRIDLAEDQSGSVYTRMQEQLNGVARQLRAEGDERAAKLRAEADGKRADLLAGATRDAQHLRGLGDAEAAAVYARSYGRNPEFANFYRSLQAYRNSIGKDGDVLVISPDSEFFRYMRSPSRREAR